MKTNVTTARAREMFRKEYNGAGNFMTPTPVSMQGKRDLAIEVTKGGFIYHVVFGVTVLRDSPDGIKREHDLSKCCDTLVEAESYIAGL